MAKRHRTPARGWLHPGLKVRKSGVHGRGVFATRAVPKGERVAIFGGDVMAIDEIDELPRRSQEFPMQIEERFVLGSRRGGAEPSDFFNHSCSPNCGIRGQLFLVAMRRIKAGEEVTFDYAMTVAESEGSDLVFEMKCRCGSPRCRRLIKETDWQRRSLQKRYGDHFSQYILERIRSGQP